ncbi:MAG: nucleotide exchange factor GrpE [Planctomycetes bacterium]|nr:nucleotide exchange factor GrpE [Planctomycetota bacterium]
MPTPEPKPAPENEPQDAAQDQDQSNAPEADASAEDMVISAAEFAALKREAAEWKERCARSQAEFDNVRKRLRKEADEAGTRGVVRFVKPILGELDNLGRALASANPESFALFAQGVSMIQTSLQSVLANAGIETIPCEGLFDPAVHEAIAEQDSDLPRGTIVQVHRAGYRLKEQLVRAAQVVVSKGAEKPAG